MKYWFYYFSKGVLWLIFRGGFGLDVRGQEHVPARGPFIVASNHVSFLDPPVVGVACPRRVSFMARATLFQGLPGTVLRGLHVIPLARGERDPGAIRTAIAQLRQGGVVAIFPEGTRQSQGLGEAKRGVGLLAANAQVPIVPALVTGTDRALPRDATWPRRAKIRVAFGPIIPYTTSSASTEDVDAPTMAARAVGRQAHQAIADRVTEAWRRLAAEPSRAQDTA